MDEAATIDSLPIWFKGIKVNYAENTLYSQKPGTKSEHSTLGKEDSKVAFVEYREGGTERRSVTWGTLRRAVTLLAAAMKAVGVRKGDRIAVIASNSRDTLYVCLACTALGAVFSSSSADMGANVRHTSFRRL